MALTRSSSEVRRETAPSTPSGRSASSSGSSRSWVRISTRGWRPTRARRRVSSPASSATVTPMSATAGLWRSNASSASAADATVAETKMSFRASSAGSASRASGYSSTRSTWTGALVVFPCSLNSAIPASGAGCVPPRLRFREPYRAGVVADHERRGRMSAHADEPDGVAGLMDPLGDAVGGVALDRLDLTARQHGLDEADVLVEDDEVARLRLLPGAGAVGPAVLLGPRVELVDRAEALAVRAERRTRLLRDPRREVGAPRSAGHGALRGRSVVRDAGRV